MLNLIISSHPVEPTDYSERRTVKAVVLGDDNRVLMQPSTLLGGGVEDDESYEEALHREVLEEAGIRVEILKPLGEVIGYRDNTKQKYIIKAYLCRFVETISEPTTTDEKELNAKPVWQDLDETMVRLESEVQLLRSEDPDKYPGTYQAKIDNRLMSIAFLKEVKTNNH